MNKLFKTLGCVHGCPTEIRNRTRPRAALRAVSTHKGVNQRSKDNNKARSRLRSPGIHVNTRYWRMHLCWSLGTLYFTHLPGESYRRRLGSSSLYLCYVLRSLITSLVCWALSLRRGLANCDPGWRLIKVTDTGISMWNSVDVLTIQRQTRPKATSL